MSKEPVVLQLETQVATRNAFRNAKQEIRAAVLVILVLVFVLLSLVVIKNNNSTTETPASFMAKAYSKLSCPVPAISGNLRIDCGNITTTPASCTAGGCCWDVTAPGFASCYSSNTVLATCPATPLPGPNRIDCGNVSTTNISCQTSGCCWNSLQGSPSCYQIPTPASTCPSVQIAAANRADCGNAQTSPASCTASGCCWNALSQGQVGPSCYNSTVTIAVNVCPATQVLAADRVDCGNAQTTATSCAVSGCCWSIPPVGQTGPACYKVNITPPTCAAIPPIAQNRIDCGGTTPNSCLQKGCCWDILAGASSCFRAPSKTCPIAPFEAAQRKPCGSILTSPQQCIDVLGCCWDVLSTNNGPSCYDSSRSALGFGTPGSDIGVSIAASTSNPGSFAVIATSLISPLGVAQMPNSNEIILMERIFTGNTASSHSYAFDTSTNAFRALHPLTGIYFLM